MQEAEVAGVLRDALLLTLRLGGPPLLVALAVGLVISVLQAITQINESTLAFVPKLLALGVTLALTGSYAWVSLADFTGRIFERLVQIGAG